MLPPITRHAVTVDIYDRKVARQYHHECGVPAIGRIALCHSANEESRVYDCHVWIRGRDRQCEAGSYREYETDQFKIERRLVTLKTAKPE